MRGFAERDVPMRPEHALMMRCIRAHFGGETTLSPDVLDNIDADVLLAEAGEHGLIPLMHQQLERMPEGWKEVFKADAQRIVASNLILARELVAITQRFADAGLDVLAFKGPAQAVQAYGDLGFRPFSDLDVLVRRGDVNQALRVLETDGYELPASYRFLTDGYEHGYHVACHHPAKGTLVEVHWHPVSDRFVVRLYAEWYWERAESVEVMGHPIPAMGREDTLLITCAHATKHTWERLEWAVSVAAMLADPARLDWACVLRRAEEGGIRRVVLTGVALAHTISGVLLPPPIDAAVEADGRVRALALDVLRTTLHRSRADNPTAAEPLHAVRFHLLVRDRLGDGVRFLLTPKDTDRELLAEPDAPLAVAVGARVYRLSKRYAVEQLGTVMVRLRRWLGRWRR